VGSLILQVGPPGFLCGFPAIRYPVPRVADAHRRQVDQQLGEIKLRVEFVPQSDAGSSNRFSVQRRSMGRGWGWRSPKRLSSDIAARSEAGQARAPAEAELPSVSPYPYGLSLRQPRNKFRKVCRIRTTRFHRTFPVGEGLAIQTEFRIRPRSWFRGAMSMPFGEFSFRRKQRHLGSPQSSNLETGRPSMPIVGQVSD